MGGIEWGISPTAPVSATYSQSMQRHYNLCLPQGVPHPTQHLQEVAWSTWSHAVAANSVTPGGVIGNKLA